MPAKLEFIVGATATGKSALAMDRAAASGGVILSCDSLCVYRGMDIGTAKPSAADRAAVPHFGLDLQDPHRSYSVGEYISYRDVLLRDLRNEVPVVFVVGGSGFYLKSFFSPVTDQLTIAPEWRTAVADRRRQGGPAALLDWLRQLNPRPDDLEGLDVRNPIRVENALLRCLASGRPYRACQQAYRSQPTPLDDWAKTVRLVERPADALQARNEARVDAMLAAGLVDEVRRLRAAGFENNPSACRAIGYAEILAYLDGSCSLEQAREAVILHTRQLMRRQRTWFRHQIPVHERIQLD